MTALSTRLAPARARLSDREQIRAEQAARQAEYTEAIRRGGPLAALYPYRVVERFVPRQRGAA